MPFYSRIATSATSRPRTLNASAAPQLPKQTPHKPQRKYSNNRKRTMNRDEEIDQLMEINGIKKRDWPVLVVFATLMLLWWLVSVI
jgi:hypothetical protein